MIIRTANLEDAPGIAKVHVRSWQQTYKGMISDVYLDNLSIEERLIFWKNKLSSPNDKAHVLVAENDNGEIFGFATFGIERSGNQEKEGELYAIYLLSSIKRQGIGTRLLYEGTQLLRKQNIESLLVWVLDENPNRKFYENFNPEKVATKVVQIGDSSCKEIAYKWDDLDALLDVILLELVESEKN
jgi:L-amino acid N-acyltransferase YncA